MWVWGCVGGCVCVCVCVSRVSCGVDDLVKCLDIMVIMGVVVMCVCE